MFLLETERLTIRPWEPEDRPALLALMSDPGVTRFINEGRPFTEAQVDESLARHARTLAEHDVCMGAAVEKSTGRVVGISGIQPLGTTTDLELGWIFSTAVWGRGYATEAGAAGMRHVLETLGRPRVVAIIHPDNVSSKRVAGRLGMTYEKRYSGAELGHRHPEIVVDLFVRDRVNEWHGEGREAVAVNAPPADRATGGDTR